MSDDKYLTVYTFRLFFPLESFIVAYKRFYWGPVSALRPGVLNSIMKKLVWPSYLHHGIPCTGETVSLYWSDPMIVTIDYKAQLYLLISRHRYETVCSHFIIYPRAESRFAPSQWETALLCNGVSHWLGASLESALYPEYKINTIVVLSDINSYKIYPRIMVFYLPIPSVSITGCPPISF